MLRGGPEEFADCDICDQRLTANEVSFLAHYGMCRPDADVRHFYSEQESSEGESEVESSPTTTPDSAASGQHVEVPLQQEVEQSPPVDVATTTNRQHGSLDMFKSDSDDSGSINMQSPPLDESTLNKSPPAVTNNNSGEHHKVPACGRAEVCLG